jgi:hemolysin D
MVEHAPADEIEPQIQSFRRGEMIFAEGSVGDVAYVVREGEVDIMKGGAGHQPVVLRTQVAGEMFGEMALITTNPRAASAVAKTDVTLEIIDRVGFTRLLQSDSEFAMLTMKRLAHMVPEAQSRLMSTFKAQDEEKDGGRGLLGLKRPKKKVDEVSAFEPDFVQIEQERVPLGIRMAGYAIVVFFLVVGIWTAFAFTDLTVTGMGKVVTTVPNIVIAPFDSGIVREVTVKNGDLVKAGQILATLDPTVSSADQESTRSALISVDAQIRRLEAEMGRRPVSNFSDDKLENNLQRQLFVSRNAQLQSTVAQYNDDIRGLESQIGAKQQETRDLERQMLVLRDITKVREEFFKKEQEVFQREGQFRLQYLEALRAQTQAERDISSSRNALAGYQAQIDSKRSQRDAFVSDWQAKINQELVMATREQAKLAEVTKKVDRAVSLIQIKAPTDAIVLNVRTRTPGTVLRAADPLIDLVPVNVPLEFEVDITPRDVAQLQIGDKASVKLDSLPFVRYGMVDGTLRLMSEDSFEKTLTGQSGPVFRGRISIDKVNLVDPPQNFRLVPGMTVTADIKVGTRSLLTYFTYPLLRSGQTSFREP